MAQRPGSHQIERAQEAYAEILSWLVRVGLLVMGVTFVLYAAEAIPAAVPISEVPASWGLDAHSYAELRGIEPGWSWVRNLADSGIIAFAGVVYFPVAAGIAVLGAAVLFARDRTYPYVVIALLEALVLALAATGWLAG
jgi:hypothetical protein